MAVGFTLEPEGGGSEGVVSLKKGVLAEAAKRREIGPVS
jgi:hypothetical protein